VWIDIKNYWSHLVVSDYVDALFSGGSMCKRCGGSIPEEKGEDICVYCWYDDHVSEQFLDL